jgi:Ulp1 family protease
MKDPNVITSNSYIVEVAIGGRIEYNRPWVDVDYVLLPILPTNRAHWMLGCLNIRKCVLYMFYSSYKTYRDKMVNVGIEPFARIIPQLMFSLGIWERRSDATDPIGMTVFVADNIPHQENGYSCD